MGYIILWIFAPIPGFFVKWTIYSFIIGCRIVELTGKAHCQITRSCTQILKLWNISRVWSGKPFIHPIQNWVRQRSIFFQVRTAASNTSQTDCNNISWISFKFLHNLMSRHLQRIPQIIIRMLRSIRVR